MLTKQEMGRQVLHIGIGLITVTLLYFDILSPFAIFLLIIVGILASFLSKRIKLPLFNFFLSRFERKKDRKTFPGKGMIFFFVGVLLVIKLFERDIALAAIMVLTLGDSVSHLFGAHFGRTKNIFNWKSKKLIEGTLAGIITGFIGAALFVPLPEAILASTVAMIAEVIKIDFNDLTLDDNLIVPLVAGVTMLLIRMYL